MAESPSAVDIPQEEELELMAAFPDLPSQCWQLASLCDRLVRTLDTDLFSKRRPVDTHLQQAMVLIATKARDDARGAVKLAKAGYGPQAAGLSRSLVEAGINSEYILGDPEKRGGAFLESINEENARLAKRLSPHGAPEGFEEAIKEAQQIQQKSGWPRNLSERAYAVSKPSYAYDVVFFMLSQLLHSSVSSMAGRLREGQPGAWDLQYDRGPQWVDTALATVFMFLYAVAKSAYTTFGLEMTKLDTMWNDFLLLQEAEKARQTAGSR